MKIYIENFSEPYNLVDQDIENEFYENSRRIKKEENIYTTILSSAFLLSITKCKIFL